MDWRKSSRSNGDNGAQCVEVAFTGSSAALRDSKNPGRTLVVSGETFRALVASARRSAGFVSR